MEDHTLSHGITDYSMRVVISFQTKLSSESFLTEEVLRCVNRTPNRNAWKLTRRDEFHSLNAIVTVLTARPAKPLLLGL